VRLGCRPHVAAPSRENRLVSLAQLVRRLDQRVVLGPPLPVQLVDGPGGDWRLRQRAYFRRVRPCLLGQQVARGGELVGRELIQPIDVLLNAA
jgi:hypothetical protein